MENQEILNDKIKNQSFLPEVNSFSTREQAFGIDSKDTETSMKDNQTNPTSDSFSQEIHHQSIPLNDIPQIVTDVQNQEHASNNIYLDYKDAKEVKILPCNTQFNFLSLQYVENLYCILNSNNVTCSFNIVIDMYLFLHIFVTHLRKQQISLAENEVVQICTEDFAKATFKFTRWQNDERPSETLMNYFRKLLGNVGKITTQCNEKINKESVRVKILDILPTRGHNCLIRFHKEFEDYINKNFPVFKKNVIRINEDSGFYLSKCQASKSNFASFAYLEKLFIACEMDLHSNLLNDNEKSILEQKLKSESKSHILKTFRSRNVVEISEEKLKELKIEEKTINEIAIQLNKIKCGNKKTAKSNYEEKVDITKIRNALKKYRAQNCEETSKDKVR